MHSSASASMTGPGTIPDNWATDTTKLHELDQGMHIVRQADRTGIPCGINNPSFHVPHHLVKAGQQREHKGGLALMVETQLPALLGGQRLNATHSVVQLPRAPQLAPCRGIWSVTRAANRGSSKTAGNRSNRRCDKQGVALRVALQNCCTTCSMLSGRGFVPHMYWRLGLHVRVEVVGVQQTHPVDHCALVCPHVTSQAPTSAQSGKLFALHVAPPPPSGLTGRLLPLPFPSASTPAAAGCSPSACRKAPSPPPPPPPLLPPTP